ncbi:MAG: minor capsid protein [Cetobacterium sp.]
MAKKSKSNAKYWEDREVQVLKGQMKDLNKLEKMLKKEYDKALKEINASIAQLFIRYMEQNELSYSEASKLLSSKEYKEWKYDLNTYIKLIEDTGDPQVLLELNTLAMKSRISRLEELFYQVDKQVNNLYNEFHKEISTFLENSVKDSYYQSIYSVHKYLGYGSAFGLLDTDIVEDILKYPWCGKNFSSTIWDNRDKLKKVLRSELTQMIIQGKGAKDVAKSFAAKMGTDFKNAQRVINTEHSYIMNEASFKSYKETGVEKYQFLATLDDKTSKICQKYDLEIIDLEKKKIGENFPPLHVNCRSTTIPYFPYEDGETRAARLPGGKTYSVPANVSYKTWYEEHVEGK